MFSVFRNHSGIVVPFLAGVHEEMLRNARGYQKSAFKLARSAFEGAGADVFYGLFLSSEVEALNTRFPPVERSPDGFLLRAQSFAFYCKYSGLQKGMESQETNSPEVGSPLTSKPEASGNSDASSPTRLCS